MLSCIGTEACAKKRSDTVALPLPATSYHASVRPGCYVLYVDGKVRVKHGSATVLLEWEMRVLRLLHPFSHYMSNITPSRLPVLVRRAQTLGHHSTAPLQLVPRASFNRLVPSNIWFIVRLNWHCDDRVAAMAAASVQPEISLIIHFPTDKRCMRLIKVAEMFGTPGSHFFFFSFTELTLILFFFFLHYEYQGSRPVIMWMSPR